eukprot:CAMPEP_0113492434 /NCGR_PEP_ID=MMETSP0014_2-20120614/28073_1 /TAXON_ID=2857 /ORGANISM="Nitzschia sp." /LENGTH=580 /DNA_ID=CAMNT_0000386263 /DNA_START=330 /DNA_END=2072 /DNA_ORIENTATION=+ /assembly_acc=CAM_ASM_000159
MVSPGNKSNSCHTDDGNTTGAAGAATSSTSLPLGGDNDDGNTQSQSQSQSQSQLLTCSFNQDGGCLAIGTTTGFSVHNLHPSYSLSVERCLRGGIGHVEMLFRCNLMALVGGGPSPHAAPHRVLVWDDHVPKEIGELAFRQAVLNVKLRKDTVAVALRDRVYVYTLADLSLRDKIYTADNPHGLLCLSTQINDMVLACPSVTTGHVRVELYGLRKTVLIEAHESTVRALTLTADGTLLATASHKGTLLRVWNVHSSSCVYEFRRGVERATITCLAFSHDDQWLACSSDKGTTHIFYCDKTKNGKNKGKTSSTKQHGKKSSSSSSTTSSFTSSLFSSGTKLLASAVSASTGTGGNYSSSAGGSSGGGGQPKSVCQVRGVPHPLACAFVSEAPNNNLVAVAGWDNDGNGVLLVSEFAAHQEPRRVVYHVLVKNSQHDHETEEARRRRRARGWRPSAPSTISPDEYFGHLTVSDTENVAETFQTQSVDDDFCEVVIEHRKEPPIDDKRFAPSSAPTATPDSTCAAPGTAHEGPEDEIDQYPETENGGETGGGGGGSIGNNNNNSKPKSKSDQDSIPMDETPLD